MTAVFWTAFLLLAMACLAGSAVNGARAARVLAWAALVLTLFILV